MFAKQLQISIRSLGEKMKDQRMKTLMDQDDINLMIDLLRICYKKIADHLISNP